MLSVEDGQFRLTVVALNNDAGIEEEPVTDCALALKLANGQVLSSQRVTTEDDGFPPVPGFDLENPAVLIGARLELVA